MASSSDSIYPEALDIIAIKWPSTHTTDQVRILSITQDSITMQYLDNDDIESRDFEDGQLPFEWQLMEKHNPSLSISQELQPATQEVHAPQTDPHVLQPAIHDVHEAYYNTNEPQHDVQYNAPQQYPPQQHQSNTNYFNKGSRWQPKRAHVTDATTIIHNEDDIEHNPYKDKTEYFQKKREKYDQSHIKQNKPKMKKKQVPQQRDIVRNLSAVTNLTTSTNYNMRFEPHVPHVPPMHHNEVAPKVANPQQMSFEPHVPPTQHNEAPSKVIHSGRIPLKGDLVEISYAGGAQNDPVRIIHTNFNGDSRIRYTDAQRATSRINFLHNKDITFKITDSVYNSPEIDFIPAPRNGDTVEIRWNGDGGRDVVRIMRVEAEYNEDYVADEHKNEAMNDFKEEDSKQDINHYDKFNAIWVTFEYVDDGEREKLDFHPALPASDICSWRILKCGDSAGLDVNQDIKMDEMDHEICTVCCTSFGEFPYRTVVPCAHNNVCAKCTLRMRVFGDFNNDKHPYPMCPFCKESWQIVAFVPLSWTISINDTFEDSDSPQNTLSKKEWNTVFSRPLEYDDEIQCYFTDIHILQKFIHIRSLYCLLCNPSNKLISNYNKVYYFHNVPKLLYHLRNDHTSFMCDLCLNNATLFMDEQRIFMNNKKLLIDHQRNGSSIEGKHGETAPHPFCTLCRRNFYSREALYEHCEDTHCSCHLCKQADILEYYASAEILSEHHRNLHHLCEERECLAKLQPVVFNDPLLLKSHQLQVHRMNKPIHSVRTAFTYGDDQYENRASAGGTMNFSTMFSQTDINYLSASRYGNNFYPQNANNVPHAMDISEEQKARNRQKELHHTMDQIKQRWFPNSYRREQQQRHKKSQALRLGLKHIPDAVPSAVRDEKNVIVIKQIRQTLISELNFKQFQRLSSSYNNNNISSSVFFHRFKNLFSPLCGEQIWVNILIQMLALLRDGKKRRALYEQYRDWVIGGRVNKTTRIRRMHAVGSRAAAAKPPLRKGGIASNAYKKAHKTNVPSAAAIVSGSYKKPTKAMIMSQRRAQSRVQKNKRKKTFTKMSIAAVPKMNVKPVKKASARVLPPSNVKGKWTKGAPKINKPKPKLVHKKKDPKIPKVTAKAPAVKQHWPTLMPAKEAVKAPPKWVEEAPVAVIHKNKPIISNSQNKKKTKRGPRKSKKKENAAKKENADAATATSSQPETAPAPKITAAKPKPKPKVVMTPKGKMPHEAKKNKKIFNKSNPWGAAPKSPPQQKMKTKAADKKGKKQQKPKQKQKQVQKAENNNNNVAKAQKKKAKAQKKTQVKNEEKEKEKTQKKESECYFEFVADAKSEIQSIYVKLSNYKDTLFVEDKVGLFLVFLFECLYSIFEFKFGEKSRYQSVELSKVWRQHIYQAVYEQFWSKIDIENKALFNDDKKTIKLKQSSFKLRVAQNVLRWNPFLFKLPAITENIATQLSALYDMLGVIDDDMDMMPLKPWMDQMDLKFEQAYCMLLYLWFILDVEIPSAPYPFIDKSKKVKLKAKSAPKTNRNTNQSENKKNRKQNQHMNKKKTHKKKQKAKPVVLFKMGGM